MAKSKKSATRRSKPAGAKPTPQTAAKTAEKSVTEAATSQTSTVTKPATSSMTQTATSKPAADTAPKTPDTTAKEKTAAKPNETPKSDTSKESPKPQPAKAVQTSKPATPAPASQKRGSFVPLVLGGVIAGGIGYFASEYNWFTGPDTSTDRFKANISANAERLTALETAEVVMPEVDLSAVDALSAKVDDLSTTLGDIDARLSIVEDRPAPDGGPSIAEQTAFEKELQALKSSAEEQRAEIATLLKNAQNVEQATAAAAQAAQAKSAVSQITAALGTGQSFADTIIDLTDAGVEPPAALADVAADGVVTLTNLQSRFPDTARAALGVARTTGSMEGESGLGGFLKRQLGARSTQPREGSDPDAVLSRAEAAVRDGALDMALAEIDTLPQDVQSAMQDWLDDARARNAAQVATQELSQSLTAN